MRRASCCSASMPWTRARANTRSFRPSLPEPSTLKRLRRRRIARIRRSGATRAPSICWAAPRRPWTRDPATILSSASLRNPCARRGMCWRMFRARPGTIAMGWNSTLRNWSGGKSAWRPCRGSCARTGRAWPMCSQRATRRPTWCRWWTMPRSASVSRSGRSMLPNGHWRRRREPSTMRAAKLRQGSPRRCRRRCSDWRWARRSLCASSVRCRVHRGPAPVRRRWSSCSSPAPACRPARLPA